MMYDSYIHEAICVSDMLYLSANIMKVTPTGHPNTLSIGTLWLWVPTEILLVCHQH